MARSRVVISGLGDLEALLLGNGLALRLGGLGALDCCSGVGFRVGALDAVCDLVIARLLPRLGVRGGGFGVLVKSPGDGLLLDPPLIYFIGQ